MRRLKILVDMDGVVADCLPRWLAQLESRTGLVLKPLEVTNWDLTRFIPPEHHRTLFEIIEEPGFFRTLQPIAGAQEGIAALLLAGHDVVFVTAATGPALSDKAAWVLRHFHSMRNRLIVTHAKTIKNWVQGDVLIDDGPHNLIDYRDEHPDAFLVGVNYPYLGEQARNACDELVNPFGLMWPRIVQAVEEGRRPAHPRLPSPALLSRPLN